MIVIVDDKTSTAPMLLAPEERWAVVNVSPLAKDDPVPPRLADRVSKETARAFGWLCGCVNATYPNSVMGPMPTTVEMDKISTSELPIDSYNRVLDYLKGYNVRPSIVRTYRAACRAGWAPKPENAYQQKIWDEYKEKPTAPMKIKFDPKKGE